jgi:hypothetical protein
MPWLHSYMYILRCSQEGRNPITSVSILHHSMPISAGIAMPMVTYPRSNRRSSSGPWHPRSTLEYIQATSVLQDAFIRYSMSTARQSPSSASFSLLLPFALPSSLFPCHLAIYQTLCIGNQAHLFHRQRTAACSTSTGVMRRARRPARS